MLTSTFLFIFAGVYNLLLSFRMNEVLNNAKRVYVFIIMLACSLAIFLIGLTIDTISDDFCEGDDTCLGNLSVFRVSLATSLFFLITTVCVSACTDFHSGWWCMKFLIFILLVAGAFLLPGWDSTERRKTAARVQQEKCTVILLLLLPGDSLVSFSEVARVLSIFFLLLQIMILLDFALDYRLSVLL